MPDLGLEVQRPEHDEALYRTSGSVKDQLGICGDQPSIRNPAWNPHDMEKSVHKSSAPGLSGNHPHYASDGAVVPCVFWDNTGVWMGFVRGKRFGYRIFPLGNCRDERFGKRGAHQHTGPSV